MKRHVAIIGAGAVGAVSAIEALRDGHRVTIIEPGEPGGEQAASYGNAGWLSSHSVIPPAEPGVWKKVPGFVLDPLGPLAIRWSYLPKAAPWLIRYLHSGWTVARVEATARALRALLVGATALHRHLADAAGVGHLIEQRGLLHVYPARASFAADGLAWGIRRQVGIEWRELSAQELREREPDLDVRYGFGVLVEEAGRCLDPGGYVAALVAHARSQGAQLIQATARGLHIEGGRLKTVATDGTAIACDAAVVCAGARSGPLAAMAGDRLPLESERGYHVMIAGTEAGLRSSMMVSDAKMVANQTTHGLRAAGQVEIAGLDATPDWRRTDILRDHLFRIFPKLPRDLPAERVRYWLGHRPSMPDGRPCIGHSSASSDVVYAFGHGHVGLVGAARTGRLVAQLLGGRPPDISLAPFDPRRFSA